MKKHIRLSALILCLLMIAGAFAACQPTSDTSDVSGNTSENGTEGGRYVADLPEFKWDTSNETYAKFKVCVYSNEMQSTYYSEEIGYGMYTTTDEVITDAVMNRNNYVTQLTGVEVVACAVPDVLPAVQNDLVGGTQLYDMAMPFMPAAATLAQEGSLYALNDEKFADYIDLSKPWWDQNANASLSVDGKLFFTIGDISIMQKIVSTAITFNKEMYATYFPGEDSLYDVVKDGDWTLDLMVRLSKAVTQDNGDGVWDSNDQWGLSSSYADSNMFYLASGQSICSKDSDDIPVFSMNNNASVNIIQNILTNLQLPNTWCIHAEQFDAANRWVVSLDIFGEGRCLFRTSAFSAIKKLRAYEEGVEFGIIPMPKMTAEQEDYYTPCSARYSYAVVIPNNVADAEFSAYMTELLCCEGKNYIADAYYETTLKSRDARDDESEEMLDLIFSNVVYDVGYIYNFGSASNLLEKMMSINSTDVASQLETITPTVEAAIEETIENFRD